MTLAVLYARYSPRPADEQPQEMDSVDKQLERGRSYCKAHDYDVAAEFFDRDLSGGRADNRPGLQDAIQKAGALKAVLVVYKLDRLARNTKDALDICDQLEKRKADLASITEQINTRSPLGKFFFTILAAFAALEREQIKARTAAAMQHYQANGRRMTRADRCPFGKQPDPSDPDRLIDHPAEQTVIEQIRMHRAEGKGLRAIARALDLAGISCRGRPWCHSTIRAILTRIDGIVSKAI